MNTTSACFLGQTRISKICKVSRFAWVVCLALMTARMANTVRDLLSHGWNMPWWYQGGLAPAELSGKVLRFQQFSFILSLVGMLVSYGLFAALFRSFEKGEIFSSA